MSRFWGTIGMNRGYQEVEPGIFDEVIDEIEVSGDMREDKYNWPQAGMQDGLRAAHVLSIVVPEDSDVDFHEVVYVDWNGHKWAVVSIMYRRPRIELTLGGLYNG